MKEFLTATILATLSLWIALGDARAQAPKITEAPKPVQDLVAAIRGKDDSGMRQEIVRRFGEPARDVGSGLHIEQWDVAGGVLTLHQATGPTFSDAKSGKTLRLLPTNNPVGKNVLTDYEMYSKPNRVHKGGAWIGNLKFGPGKEYRFEESPPARGTRGERPDNFFFQHPCGTVEVLYPEGINAETPLESLAEGSVVARLKFTSGPTPGRAEFVIKSSEKGRHLSFDAEKPLPFGMGAAWRDFGLQEDETDGGKNRTNNSRKK
jgi:hypothetical protein